MSDKKESRREISVGELKRLNVNVSKVQAHGLCTIFDKDGNVKSTFEVGTDHLTPQENKDGN